MRMKFGINCISILGIIIIELIRKNYINKVFVLSHGHRNKNLLGIRSII